MSILPKSFGDVEDENTREHIKHLQQESQGNVITLSSAPTASTPLLEANQVGKYGNDIYWRVENTIYKISSDSQITIT